MSNCYLPSVVVCLAVFVPSVGGLIGDGPTVDSTYIDPHLVVLLFLFGFSLLYAVLLLLDVARQKPGTDRASEE